MAGSVIQANGTGAFVDREPPGSHGFRNDPAIRNVCSVPGREAKSLNGKPTSFLQEGVH